MSGFCPFLLKILGEHEYLPHHHDSLPKGTLMPKMDNNIGASSTDTREKCDFHYDNISRGKIDEESQDMKEKEAIRKIIQTAANNGRKYFVAPCFSVVKQSN